MIRRLALEAKGLRHVAVLFTGTVLAQLIPLAVSPILGRLFSPAEFGSLAAFLAMASIVTIAVTGRYELAVIPARTDRRAAVLVRLAVVLAIACAGFGGLLLPLFDAGSGALGAHVYLLPVSVFLLAAERTCNYWLSRRYAFNQLSVNRMLQGVATAVSQIVAGTSGMGVWGLLGGQILGQLTAFLLACRSAWIAGLSRIRKVGGLRTLLRTARTHREYPGYLIPAGLANEAAAQLPLLILAGSYGAEAVGYLAITQRLMMAPVSLTASAVGDVFRSQAAAAYRRDGHCAGLFIRYLGFVAAGGLILMIPFVVAGKAVFVAVFGGQWEYAGELADTLSILAYGQLISLPFAQTSLLAGLQRVDFIWNVARLITNVAVLLGSIWLGLDFERALLLYCCSSAAMFLIHLCIQYYAARGGGIRGLPGGGA